MGFNALAAGTTAIGNTGVGQQALNQNSSGKNNTALGLHALFSNLNGSNNTVAGHNALADSMTASFNTVVGDSAMVNSSLANSNTAIGHLALANSEADNNIGIGANAGSTSGIDSNNIFIGNVGTAGDTGVIRIGDGGTNQLATYLSGDVYATTFNQTSDRNAKSDFQGVRPADILAGVARLPVETWQYKADRRGIRHIGPTAQDFYKAFSVGEDDRHIGTIDEGGVALAAVKALDTALKAEQARTVVLRREVAELKHLMQQQAGTADADTGTAGRYRTPADAGKAAASTAEQ